MTSGSPRGLGTTVGRGGWTGTARAGVECFHGMRYARLGDPSDPRSISVPSGGQVAAPELIAVPVFPQLPSRLEVVTGPGGRDNPQHEEAFFLNVWTPTASTRLPVLVFIHGGAWASGGGSMRWYRGERLAAEGIVVVTLNYRLGPAGHLDSGDGHVPFGDLLLALTWVQRHIARFGGDPDRVTVAGQSAGGWYTWALASAPEASGLFTRAAVHSSPWIEPWTRDDRRSFTQKAEQALGSDGWLGAGARALAGVLGVPGAMPPMYLPSLDADQAARLASPATASEHLHVSALHVRVTHHEMSVFLPWGQGHDADAARLERLRSLTAGVDLPAYPGRPEWGPVEAETIERSSWWEFGRFAADLTDTARVHGVPAQFRDFGAWAGPVGMGSAHCLDLPFQFGNSDDWADAPIMAGWEPDDFERVSAEVRADLIDFVNGLPAPDHRTLGV